MVRDQALGVRVLLQAQALRQWQLDLLERMSAACGLAVEAVLVDDGPGLPVGAERIFRLEAAAYGLSPPASSASVLPGAFAKFATGAASPILVIDLTDGGSSSPDADADDAAGALAPPRRWRLTYDGIAGEGGLLASVFAHHAPVAEIREGADLVIAARLGTENPGVTREAFEDGLSRVVTVILSALATLQAPARAPAPAIAYATPCHHHLRPRRLAVRAARTVARAAVRHSYRLCFASPHWRVGWRRIDGPDLVDRPQHPAGGWTDLPDDGKRFYADPFAIEHQGRTFLFVEDFQHALGRGIISVVEMGADGPIGRPEPVLEQPCHLSYPFVFAAEGEMWMIPESSGAGTVELYRATAFPGGWVKEETLLSGIVASDATLIERDGRVWMFATVRDGNAGAFSDVLHLWSADSFRGPFRPHAGNPVLIDIASARPAGRMVERDGVLWRPVQDCRNGYGAALGLARVERLDDGGFAQTVETILRAGPGWPGRRLHTLNRSGSFEFIDGSARAPRRF